MDEAFRAWPKHFVYLSPPKIDSLFGQIASKDLRSIARSVTVDLKVLKAEFGPASPRPETVYSRLRVVLEYLDRHTMIGSIDEPGASIHQSASLDIVCDFETSCDALKAP